MFISAFECTVLFTPRLQMALIIQISIFSSQHKSNFDIFSLHDLDSTYTSSPEHRECKAILIELKRKETARLALHKAKRHSSEIRLLFMNIFSCLQAPFLLLVIGLVAFSRQCPIYRKVIH